jgi:hypothetical protein
MDESKPDRRRRFPRIHSENLVLVKKFGILAVEGLGKTEQVGLGGCKFLHQEPLGVGSLVELTLSIRGHLLNTRARVLYEMPHDGEFTEVGAEFVALSPGDRETLALLFGPEGTVLAEG